MFPMGPCIVWSMCLKSSHRVNVYYQNDIVHVVTVKLSFDPKSLGINLHEAHSVPYKGELEC